MKKFDLWLHDSKLIEDKHLPIYCIFKICLDHFFLFGYYLYFQYKLLSINIPSISRCLLPKQNIKNSLQTFFCCLQTYKSWKADSSSHFLSLERE